MSSDMHGEDALLRFGVGSNIDTPPAPDATPQSEVFGRQLQERDQ